MYDRAIELFFARNTRHVLPRCKTAGHYQFDRLDSVCIACLVFDGNNPFPLNFHNSVYLGTKPDSFPQRPASKGSSINVVFEILSSILGFKEIKVGVTLRRTRHGYIGELCSPNGPLCPKAFIGPPRIPNSTQACILLQYYESAFRMHLQIELCCCYARYSWTRPLISHSGTRQCRDIIPPAPSTITSGSWGSMFQQNRYSGCRADGKSWKNESRPELEAVISCCLYGLNAWEADTS